MSRTFQKFAGALACLATVTVTLHDAAACGGRGGGGGYGGGYGRSYSSPVSYAPQQYPYSQAQPYPPYSQVARPQQQVPLNSLPQQQFAQQQVQPQPQPQPQQQNFPIQQASAQVAQQTVAQPQVAQQPVAQGQFAQRQVAQTQVAQGQVAQGQIAQGQIAQSQVRQASVAQGPTQGQFTSTQAPTQTVNVQKPVVNQQALPPQNAAPQNVAPQTAAPQNNTPQVQPAPATAPPATQAPANEGGDALQALLGSNTAPPAAGQSDGYGSSMTGVYVANVSNATVRLTLNADGTFLWQATKDGKASSFQGQFAQQNGSLTLNRSDNQKLEGLMGVTSSGFTLRLGQSETSLTFVRA